MTTVAYASDLHLEFGNPVPTEGLEKADILVLAGDVDTIPEGWADLLRQLRKVFSGPIVGVLGNHEYYNGVFPDDGEKFRDAIAHDRQAYLLEKEMVILDGVRFLGATLCTDFASGRQMRSCQRVMADFDVIFDGHSGSITPELILKEHQDTMDWLDTQIVRHPHKGPTVVITHHAPSYQSQHPRFAGSLISGASALIRSIAFSVGTRRALHRICGFMAMCMIPWITASARPVSSAIRGDIPMRAMTWGFVWWKFEG